MVEDLPTLAASFGIPEECPFNSPRSAGSRNVLAKFGFRMLPLPALASPNSPRPLLMGLANCGGLRGAVKRSKAPRPLPGDPWPLPGDPRPPSLILRRQPLLRKRMLRKKQVGIILGNAMLCYAMLYWSMLCYTGLVWSTKQESIAIYTKKLLL